MNVPPAFPVSTCQRSGDLDYLPWLSWRASQTEHMKERRTNPVIMRWGDACDRLIEAVGQDVVRQDTRETLWKFLPTDQVVDGLAVFRLFNWAKGEVTQGSIQVDGYGFGRAAAVVGTTANVDGGVVRQVRISGVCFAGVTRDSPELWVRRNGESVSHTMYWVASWDGRTGISGTIHTNERVQVEYYNRSACNSIYRAGFQISTDPKDLAPANFVMFDGPGPEVKDIYYPNPYFGIGTQGERIGRCIALSCRDVLGSNQACRDFITQNPGDASIAALLDSYCRADPDRALNDPLCGIWCADGLTGNTTIREGCLSQRKSACSKYYDSTTKTWSEAATDEIRSRCSCYMPDEFYSNLLTIAGVTVPPGSTPNCFYQPCADSAIGRQSFTPQGCNAVTACIQSDGRTTTVNCVNSSNPTPGEPGTDPTDPGTSPTDPGTNPPPIGDPDIPVSGISWGWIIFAIVVIILIIVVVVILLSSSKKPETNSSLLVPLLLAEQAKNKRVYGNPIVY